MQSGDERAPCDPYHHCRTGWSTCCAQNARAMTTAAPALKYVGEFAHTYADWWWGNELFFEQLPRPSALAPTACGVCHACVTHYYERKRKYMEEVTPCPFPQPPGAYAEWHAARVREWFAPKTKTTAKSAKSATDQ